MESTEQITTRDRNLDIYRGCIMMYIVGIIHTISIYSNWYENTAATLLLIEMPVVFYISGAAYSLSSKKSYPQYIWGRVKRIIPPYYIFIAIITIANYFKQCIWGYTSTNEFIRHFIENRYYSIFIEEIYGLEHIWFVPTYLKIALILPLLYRISQKITVNGLYVLLGISATILYFIPNHEVCYAVFALAGMYYQKSKPYNKYLLLSITMLLMILCYKNGYSINMQINKFPANLFFLSYAAFMLLLLKKPLQRLCLLLARTPIKHLIAIYAKHDFCIYLYHTAVISSFVHLMAYLFTPALHNPAISLPIATIYTLIISAIAGIFLDKTNHIITRKLSKLWNKTRPIFVR